MYAGQGNRIAIKASATGNLVKIVKLASHAIIILGHVCLISSNKLTIKWPQYRNSNPRKNKTANLKTKESRNHNKPKVIRNAKKLRNARSQENEYGGCENGNDVSSDTPGCRSRKEKMTTEALLVNSMPLFARQSRKLRHALECPINHAMLLNQEGPFVNPIARWFFFAEFLICQC
jgi:hypothetical protein